MTGQMTGRPASLARLTGFSLLEVLVALMVLGVGAASVLALFGAAASTHKRSVDRTHAGLVAERVLAEIGARYTLSKSAGELHAEIRKELPERFGDYVWEAYLYQPGKPAPRRGRREESEGAGDWQPHELFARVSVRWKRSGRRRAETFSTILLPRRVARRGR
ncbi:MAG: prepilin-type N-terminal cleavage/methylation domain-containing protein [Planctomycetota bacterium]|nr:prepilin-type N-terminal cleavage/methylation domain-containing protein [Planctomycetota bacterium]